MILKSFFKGKNFINKSDPIYLWIKFAFWIENQQFFCYYVITCW